MKKLFSVLFVLCCSLPVFCASNNIKMVTYFPIPYVSYNSLDVSKTLDIGVMKCHLKLEGNPSLSVYKAINARDYLLKQGTLRVASGKLELNAVSGSVISQIMTVGKIAGATGSLGSLTFENSLRVVTQTNRGQSLQVDTEAQLDDLILFPANMKAGGGAFPRCNYNGSQAVSWQKLRLKDKEETYLVCGQAGAAPAPSDCSDSEYKKNHTSECCPGTPETDDGVCWSCYKWCPAEEERFIVHYPDGEAATGECQNSPNSPDFCQHECMYGTPCTSCTVTNRSDDGVELHWMHFTPKEKCSPRF